jgi:ankyrin repeat protein
LNNAFYIGNSKLVKLLLEHGAEIDCKNARSWTSISYLWDPQRQQHSSEEVAKILTLSSSNYFSAWNDTDTRGWTPAHRAAAYGTFEDIYSLRCKGANMHKYTTEYHWGPIHYAIWFNNESTFDALVDQDTLPRAEIVELRDTRGWTLLHFAAQKGSEHMIRKLLASGINRAVVASTDIWIKDELEWKSMTAEDIARGYGHGEIWDKLIQEMTSD